MTIQALKEAAEKALPGAWDAEHNGRTIAGTISKGINADFRALANPSAILSLIAKLEAAEKALKPFAFIAECEPNTPDGDSTMVNISRCRDARTALSTLTKE